MKVRLRSMMLVVMVVVVMVMATMVVVMSCIPFHLDTATSWRSGSNAPRDGFNSTFDRKLL
jgi:hypothetical protein